MTTTTPPTTPPMMPQVLPVFEDDESFLTGTADCVTWVPVDVPTEPSALVKVEVKVDVTSLRVMPAREEGQSQSRLGRIRAVLRRAASSWSRSERPRAALSITEADLDAMQKRRGTHCSRPETPPKNQK